MRRVVLLSLSVVLFAALAPSGHATGLTFVTKRLLGSDGHTEPRVTVAPDGMRYAVTTRSSNATVYASADGRSWKATAADLPGQRFPTIDLDIASSALPGGGVRLVASELDEAGITFKTGYTDDGGKTWTASTGMVPADTDRQWFAVGNVNDTGLSDVYMLWHNLASGAVSHNMWVQTSHDGGASFGAPVPVTLPGEQAWLDLQCADSGAPSGIAVDHATGRLYVSFSTRTAPAGGGCGASVFGPFEINIVFATRTWVATSPDNTVGSWSSSLAVDGGDRAIELGFNPPAVDTAGNVYIVYSDTSESSGPDDFRAKIRYVSSPPAGADWTMGSHWSAPVTVTPVLGDGHILPDIVAGAPGKLDIAYWEASGTDPVSGKPTWWMTVSQTLDGGASFTTLRPVSPLDPAKGPENPLLGAPTYIGTANESTGDCAAPGDPTRGVQAGFVCSRTSDDFGMALDAAGRMTVVWSSDQVTQPGTFVATQTDGPGVF